MHPFCACSLLSVTFQQSKCTFVVSQTAVPGIDRKLTTFLMGFRRRIQPESPSRITPPPRPPGAAGTKRTTAPAVDLTPFMAGDDTVCCSKSKGYRGCEYVCRSVLGWVIKVRKAFGYSTAGSYQKTENVQSYQ